MESRPEASIAAFQEPKARLAFSHSRASPSGGIEHPRGVQREARSIPVLDGLDFRLRDLVLPRPFPSGGSYDSSEASFSTSQFWSWRCMSLPRWL